MLLATLIIASVDTVLNAIIAWIIIKAVKWEMRNGS